MRIVLDHIRGKKVPEALAILHGARLIVDRPRGDLSWEELRRLYVSLTEGNGVAP